MKSTLENFAFVMILSLFPIYASGQSTADMVDVVEPYARASLPGISISVAFMALKNNSGERRTLVAAESPVADTVEIHNHVMSNGMMKMRKVAGIDLNADDTRLLRPGGFHVMLIGLKQILKHGESFPLELIYRDGSRDRVKVPVVDMNRSERFE